MDSTLFIWELAEVNQRYLYLGLFGIMRDSQRWFSEEIMINSKKFCLKVWCPSAAFISDGLFAMWQMLTVYICQIYIIYDGGCAGPHYTFMDDDIHFFSLHIVQWQVFFCCSVTYPPSPPCQINSLLRQARRTCFNFWIVKKNFFTTKLLLPINQSNAAGSTIYYGRDKCFFTFNLFTNFWQNLFPPYSQSITINSLLRQRQILFSSSSFWKPKLAINESHSALYYDAKCKIRRQDWWLMHKTTRLHHNAHL